MAKTNSELQILHEFIAASQRGIIR